jgi:hypothetical protein
MNYLLSSEKKVRESRKNKKDGNHQSGVEKNLFKTATREARSESTITAKGGA